MHVFNYIVVPQYLWGIVPGPPHYPQPPADTKIRGCSSPLYKMAVGASLVAQWLRVCLPMQGTRVRALVWEDPTCRGVTRPP